MNSESAIQFRVLSLEPLVRIKLAAFRDKDKVHVRDLIDVGLVDETWLTKLPEALSVRLKSILDTPGGMKHSFSLLAGGIKNIFYG